MTKTTFLHATPLKVVDRVTFPFVVYALKVSDRPLIFSAVEVRVLKREKKESFQSNKNTQCNNKIDVKHSSIGSLPSVETCLGLKIGHQFFTRAPF